MIAADRCFHENSLNTTILLQVIIFLRLAVLCVRLVICRDSEFQTFVIKFNLQRGNGISVIDSVSHTNMLLHDTFAICREHNFVIGGERG